MTGRNPPQGSTRADPGVSSGRKGKTVSRSGGSLACLLAAACGATLALGAPATARPLEDEDRGGPRSVLEGRASLAPGELGGGGWSIVTDEPDRLVLVSGAARVRVVVDAAVGATAGDPGRGKLVAALSHTDGLAAASYVTRPAGVFVVFDADPSIRSEQEESWFGSTESGCTVLPWPGAGLYGTTLTGEGDAKVVLGTPCTVERVYVVTRGAGNLLVEAQVPRGTDDPAASLDAMDELVMTLVPAGARIDDNLSPLDHAHR
ncbi:hypothetical protein GCM10009809_00800 [Isoptericola hypogeus]|uniref:Secreted protein n=1 Tax=Isoptericola hypogeus TaxID=300179 RepID=A0ABP4UMQ0_9MICO